MNRYARKSIKILLWVLGILVLLVALALLLIQTSYVQKIAKNKIVSFLEEKIKTPVSIGKLSVDFPKRIVLEDVYFEDQSGDTLLAGDTLKVDIRLLKLLNRQVVIHEIDLRGVTSHIKHTLPDSAFNFDYILNTFIKGKAKKVDSTAAMVFSVDKINLDRFNIKMDDEVNGNNISIYLNHFDTRIKTFDLENKKFTVPNIKLAGLTATLRQTKALSRESVRTDTINFTSPNVFPDIDLEVVDISDIHVAYDNTVTSVNSRVDLDSLLIEFDNLDLPNQNADVRLVRLANTSGRFALGETAQEAVEATAIEVKETLEKGWRINLEKLGISNVDFKFDDLTDKEVSRGIDYSHLDIKDLEANITQIIYNADTISGSVNHISLTDRSGLDLKNFRGDFYFGKQHAGLSDFVIETADSYINDHFEIFYPSLDTIAKNPGIVTVDAQFENSKIAVSDILLFAPQLRSQPLIGRNQNDVIFVDGDISGRINNLDINDLNISGIGDIRLLASGNIQGLPDPEKLSFDVDIERLSASATDLSAFIPRRVASQIRIPEAVTMRGTFKGTFDRFTT
ncbi:MAG: AsmA family protein, partial [Saprospiraceae bacterium]